MKHCSCGPTAALCENCISQKEAKQKITDFFFWYSPEEAREELMYMMQAALAVPEQKITSAQAGKKLFFFHQLFKLIDASHKLRVVNFPKPGNN